MRNVTITVEDDALEWARVEAAKRGSSVSRMVGDMLAERMRADDAYAQAMRESLQFRSWGEAVSVFSDRDAVMDREVARQVGGQTSGVKQ
jgi:hypothetical protein